MNIFLLRASDIACCLEHNHTWASDLRSFHRTQECMLGFSSHSILSIITHRWICIASLRLGMNMILRNPTDTSYFTLANRIWQPRLAKACLVPRSSHLGWSLHHLPLLSHLAWNHPWNILPTSIFTHAWYSSFVTLDHTHCLLILDVSHTLFTHPHETLSQHEYHN